MGGGWYILDMGWLVHTRYGGGWYILEMGVTSMYWRWGWPVCPGDEGGRYVFKMGMTCTYWRWWVVGIYWRQKVD